MSNTFPLISGWGYWLGYTDKVQEGLWTTVTGDIPLYHNWYPGEPNQSGEENYAVTVFTNDTWQWNDMSLTDSNAPKSAIIERTAAPNINITANPFTVQAADETGTAFTVPAGKTQCTFTATGTWKWDVPSPAVTPDGGGSAYAGFRIPTGNAFDLILQRTGGEFEHVGAAKDVGVIGGDVLHFLMNDMPGHYYDNSGELSVSVSCQ